MRFVLTDEEKRLGNIVDPWMKLSMKPFGYKLVDDAPDNVKEAYAKLNALLIEHENACSDYDY